jgi:uncharacterized RDD family membrane protein YckC
MEYAGFWRRFAAWIIDYLVLGVAGFVVGFVWGLVAGDDDSSLIVLQLVITVASFLYFAFMESSTSQATVGKMALGIKVTDLNGNRISFGRALGRTFAKILSGLIILIGYIMAAFTAKKQGLHDMIASTLVVKAGT